MARPRSEQRRQAILAAATTVIAAQGLGAPTAAIAKAAGVSNGSLFGYFETKAVLVNDLFVALKVEMAGAAVDGLPMGAGPQEQMRHLWTRWLAWAVAEPAKRRALAQLAVADEITEASHRAVGASSGGIAAILERSRAGGPVQDVPLRFVLVLINAVAEAAIDAILTDPTGAEARSAVAFDAMWRILAGSGEPAST